MSKGMSLAIQYMRARCGKSLMPTCSAGMATCSAVYQHHNCVHAEPFAKLLHAIDILLPTFVSKHTV
eukprot:351970-Chlamydomonas_euryale.AAC.9